MRLFFVAHRVASYAARMIKALATAATERLYCTGKNTFPKGMDATRAEILLQMLNSATALQDITPYRSMELHALKGNRKGQWAITINGPWRICSGSRMATSMTWRL